MKQRLVDAIDAGHFSIREAARNAQSTVTMMQKWLEEYGRFKPKRDVVAVVMKSEQDQITALKVVHLSDRGSQYGYHAHLRH